MNKKFVTMAAVAGNERLGGDVYRLVALAPDICRQARPGQFVQVKTGRANSPLLRRPLSIADIQGERLTLIYRVVGEGTAWLAACRSGDMIDIMGPLGSGFALDALKPLLLGGGLGIAPLLYLARAFATRGITPGVLLADRGRGEIGCWQPLFEPFCPDIYITTDDGSLGTRGNALALLPEVAGRYDHIYACGPAPMLRAVSGFVRQHGIPCQISLESHMACGLGACQACSCQAADGGRKRICLNGPVFAAGEVVL